VGDHLELLGHKDILKILACTQVLNKIEIVVRNPLDVRQFSIPIYVQKLA